MGNHSGGRKLTAFAKSVLPHPGGPYKRTPAGARSPSAINFSGWRMGSTTAVLSSLRSYMHDPKDVEVRAHVSKMFGNFCSRKSGWVFLFGRL